jgi:hypothetical protein
MKLYCQDSSHFQSFQSESQGAVHQEDSCFPNFDRKSFKIDKLNRNGFKSKNDADEAVSLVCLTSSSGGYINGRNSANLELLIDKTSLIYLYVNFKALAS